MLFCFECIIALIIYFVYKLFVCYHLTGVSYYVESDPKKDQKEVAIPRSLDLSNYIISTHSNSRVSLTKIPHPQTI